MAAPYQHKRSTTAAAVPTLLDGELGINQRDGKLFWKDHNGTVQSKSLTSEVEAETSSGTAIQFDRKRHYGQTTALTGDMTLNSTGATPGMEVVIRHNHSAAPSVPSEWKLLSGEYKVSVDNYLVVYCFTTTSYLYLIRQVKV